eukprot:scaffold31559_cov32-Tisochrysis_lutea.AAC.6
MSDGSGSAEDPNGLPMGELLRLFEAGQPLAMMRTNELSPTGIMTTADTPEVRFALDAQHPRPVPPRPPVLAGSALYTIAPSLSRALLLGIPSTIA